MKLILKPLEMNLAAFCMGFFDFQMEIMTISYAFFDIHLASKKHIS